MPIPVMDLHCDTADRLGWQTLDLDLRMTCGQDFYGEGDDEHPTECCYLEHNRGAISLEKIGSTPWAQCFATFIPDELSPEQAIRFQAQIMAHISGQANLNHGTATEARRVSDIRPALEKGRTVVVHTIENARLFAADLGLVEMLHNVGVQMASLSWNAQGPLASGHDSHAGLTDCGRRALAEMERVGMVLDVSHLNDECFDEVAALATRPFVASHSNARAVCGHPRNLTDDQFRRIVDAGGVVGLNYCSEFLADGHVRADRPTHRALARPRRRGRHRARRRSRRSGRARLPVRCLQVPGVPEQARQAFRKDNDRETLLRERRELLRALLARPVIASR